MNDFLNFIIFDYKIARYTREATHVIFVYMIPTTVS